MADIVNLRMARKRKGREDRERLADQNRLLHGRSKAEKSSTKAETERAAAILDGHLRELPPGDPKP